MMGKRTGKQLLRGFRWHRKRTVENYSSRQHISVSSLIWCLFCQHIECWKVALVTHSQMMTLYRKGRGTVIGKLGLILSVLIRVYG